MFRLRVAAFGDSFYSGKLTMINKPYQMKRKTPKQAIPPGMRDPKAPPPKPVETRMRSADEDSVGMRIKTARENLELTQDDLAKRLINNRNNKNYTRSTVAQWERNDSVPPLEVFDELAKELNTTSRFLAFGDRAQPQVVAPDPDELGYALVPEVRVGGEDTFNEVVKWGLPTQWLRSEIGAPDPSKVLIYHVEVDSAGFGYGDRVLVDRAANRPSPPGKFLHWDGVGPVISNITVIPAHSGAKKAMAKVTTNEGTYETEVDRLKIIGRVKGVWAKA
jgi:transcriptional regulator with XRE-family HTH domain